MDFPLLLLEQVMEFKVLGDNVLVKPIDPAKTTPGGLVLPDQSKGPATKGTVVKVGCGRMLESGARNQIPIEEGDFVIFKKYGATEVEVGEETYFSVAEESILAVVTG